MVERPGLALLGALMVLQFLLVFSPLGPYGTWALVAAGVWLCRRDPELAPGVPWAFAALAASIVLALVGGGVTLGTAAGPLASAGEDTGAGGALGFLLPAVAPAALLLASSRDAAVRGLARAGAGFVALAFAAMVRVMLAQPSRTDGTLASQMSLLALVVGAAYLLVLSAFALPPARGALAWVRQRGAAA